MRNLRIKGFTLIELMVVVAIVAILAAIAYPSFVDSVRKSRRSDAINALTNLHLEMVKDRGNSIVYVARPAFLAPDEYYQITTAVPGAPDNAQDFTLTANAQGDQANDPCGNFVLDVDDGVPDKYTSTYASGTEDANRCWAR